MPPKAKGKKGKGKADNVIRIDRSKHDTKLKEIAESHRQAELEEMEEEVSEEEEMGSEEEEEEAWSDIEPAFEVGRIDLSFPETTAEFSDSEHCYPPSYYSLSPKERLLLLYAENFRKQFVVCYPKRRALVLALPNECNVQKFVCATLRPTAFLHVPLIGSEIECAKFVADFIIYEPLEDMMKFGSAFFHRAAKMFARMSDGISCLRMKSPRSQRL